MEYFNKNCAKSFIITVDVEDWFQVENLRSVCPVSMWDNMKLRVEANIDRLLDLFDSLNIKATFFVLGWLAKKLPSLIKKIHNQGHEISSHGFWHIICSKMDKSQLIEELDISKKLLEDIIGNRVYGFRAPNFSVTKTLLQCLKHLGYEYDSSYNSFKLNPRYGSVDKKEIRNDLGGVLEFNIGLYEIPVSNFEIKGIVFPAGGGTYFRIFPLFLFQLLVQFILKQKGWYLFYMHPWEIDPGQPKIAALSLNHRFRHYINLDKTFERLKKMCNYFKSKDNIEFISCSEFLSKKILI
ncbi:DUF3473 domain-containing protein [Desulfothermus naphthae]